MNNKIKKIFKKLTPWSDDNNSFKEDHINAKDAIFNLIYDNKDIGTLEHKNNKWIFKYSDNFIMAQFVLPLIDFPIIEKKYEFEELPPFFAARIPKINQPFHAKKLSKNKGDKNDIVSLLEIFGEKSINNPFELKSHSFKPTASANSLK